MRGSNVEGEKPTRRKSLQSGGKRQLYGAGYGNRSDYAVQPHSWILPRPVLRPLARDGAHLPLPFYDSRRSERGEAILFPHQKNWKVEVGLNE